MSNIPISYPARYAPGIAMNFADESGTAIQVSQASPLPVTMAAAVSGGTTPPAPLTGSTAIASTTGSFVPVAGKPLVLTLTGTWTGTVKLLRSVNGGTTKLPLTLAGAPWGEYAANVNEPVWEENEAAAVFYLQLAPLTGTVTYRLAQ